MTTFLKEQLVFIKIIRIINIFFNLPIAVRFLLLAWNEIPSEQLKLAKSLNVKYLNYFKLIITKYPKSKYAKDAKLKIHFLKNTLAKNELNIGKFYLKKGAPASSIKRFKSILLNYQNTSVIPETLYRLSEAFLLLGLKDEAIKSTALLNYNFSDNYWTKLSKNLLKNKTKLDHKKDTEFSIINYLKDFF